MTSSCLLVAAMSGSLSGGDNAERARNLPVSPERGDASAESGTVQARMLFQRWAQIRILYFVAQGVV